MTQPPIQITVEVDLFVTRRSRVHQVRNASTEVLFYAKTVGDLLRWLHENDHNSFTVVDEGSRFEIALSVPRAPPKAQE